MKKFWLVVKGDQPIARKWLTRKGAISEAKAIDKETGTTCIVMESVGVTAPSPSPVVFKEMTDEH